MDLSRMYRIAETGDVNDPTPVDNVLRMVEAAARQKLGYGVIGAGNTVGILNQNRQYADRLALKQQERCPTITYAPQDKFIDFVDSLREDYSEYRLRCIDNQGTDRKTGKNRPDYFGKQ